MADDKNTTIGIKIKVVELDELKRGMKAAYQIPADMQQKQAKAQAKHRQTSKQAGQQQGQTQKQRNAALKEENRLIAQNNKLSMQQQAIQRKNAAMNRGSIAGHGKHGAMGRFGRGMAWGATGSPNMPGSSTFGAMRGAGAMGVAGAGVGLAAGAVATVVAAVVGAVVHAVTSQIQPSFNAYKQDRHARAGILALTGGAGDRVGAAQTRGREMGFSPLETLQAMRGVGRATGSVDNVTMAQQYGRLFAMDTGEISDIMGSMTKGGTNFQSGKGRKQFEQVMSSAVASGLDRSRAGEHLHAVTSLIGDASGRTAGAVDSTNIAGLLGIFSKSGMAGLQGERGANVMRSFDRIVTGAGAGGNDPVSALVMRAMGFGTGGGASYADATRKAQRGVLGAGGAENLQAVMGQFNREYGSGTRGSLALSRATNLSMDQVEAVRRVMAEGGPDMNKRIGDITRSAMPADQQLVEIMRGDILTQLKHEADIEDQQIKQGEKIAASMRQMEHAVDELVHSLWPILVELMRVAADALTWITHFLKDAFRGMTGTATANAAISSSQSELEMLNKRRAGMTPEEYRAELARINGRLSTARDDLANEDMGPLAQAFNRFLPGGEQRARSRRAARDELAAMGQEIDVYSRHGGYTPEAAAEARQARELRARIASDRRGGVPGVTERTGDGRLGAHYTPQALQYGTDPAPAVVVEIVPPGGDVSAHRSTGTGGTTDSTSGTRQVRGGGRH